MHKSIVNVYTFHVDVIVMEIDNGNYLLSLFERFQ